MTAQEHACRRYNDRMPHMHVESVGAVYRIVEIVIPIKSSSIPCEHSRLVYLNAYTFKKALAKFSTIFHSLPARKEKQKLSNVHVAESRRCSEMSYAMKLCNTSKTTDDSIWFLGRDGSGWERT